MRSDEVDARVEALRQRLTTATEFSEVFDYFERELVNSPGLIQASRPQTNKMLAAILEASVARVLRGPSRLSQVMCLRYASSDFFHGGAFAGGAMVMFLWFATTTQGLAVVGVGSGPTHFVRLTGTELPAAHVPMRRPAGRPS